MLKEIVDAPLNQKAMYMVFRNFFKEYYSLTRNMKKYPPLILCYSFRTHIVLIPLKYNVLASIFIEFQKGYEAKITLTFFDR